jgi:hypothetical protein
MRAPSPVLVAEERSIAVPAGRTVSTGYVEVHCVRMACRERMALGDVDVAYRRRLQLGAAQPWPPPLGYWEQDRFVLMDGRHDFVAALMLGVTHLLVAWLEA